MNTLIEDNICAVGKLIKAKMLVRPNNTHFINCYTNLLTTIIVVPLHEILDNIYQLLVHAPTCQSSLSFTPVQSVLHHEKVAGTAGGDIANPY